MLLKRWNFLIAAMVEDIEADALYKNVFALEIC